MKNALFPIAVVGLLLAGCSSAYKTGQTPDDVYFSQGAVVAAEVSQKQKADDDYQSYWSNPDDDYLRMKVQKGGRWNGIDDFDYWYGYNSFYTPFRTYSYGNFYNPWAYGGLTFSYGYNPWAWNNYFYSGGYYGGSYPGYYFPTNITSKYPTAYSNPSRPSLRGYGNSTYGSPASGSGRRVSTSSSGYRSIFGGSSNGGNSNSGSTYERPTRVFEPSSSSGSSSGGGSSRSSGGGGSSSGGGGSRGGRGG